MNRNDNISMMNNNIRGRNTNNKAGSGYKNRDSKSIGNKKVFSSNLGKILFDFKDNQFECKINFNPSLNNSMTNNNDSGARTPNFNKSDNNFVNRFMRL